MKTKVMQRPRKNSSEIEVLSRNVGVRGRRDRIFDGMMRPCLCLPCTSPARSCRPFRWGDI